MWWIQPHDCDVPEFSANTIDEAYEMIDALGSNHFTIQWRDETD